MREDFSRLVDPKNYGSFMDALYGLVVKGDTTSQEKVLKTVQAFLEFPDKKKRLEIEAFTTKGDMPELYTRLPYINIEAKNFDFGYEAAFRPVALDSVNGVSKLTWEIVTASDNIVFSEMAEGEAPVIAGKTADRIFARCTRKSGALGWTEELIRDRALAVLIDNAEMFRNKFYYDKANRHYAGMTAASSVNSAITWQSTTETVGVNLDRDRKTLNVAAGYLANLLKDKGYGDTANATFLLFINPTAMKSRIQTALSTAMTGVIVPTQVVWNIVPVYTLNANLPATSTTGIMVLPGNKIQRADAMAPTSFMKANVASMTYEEYVHAFYGYAIADTDQLVNVQFA
jgi:hypothetical protein